MNYFEMMAYTNIGLCILLVVLIVIELIKMSSLNRIDTNTDTNNMAIYEIQRELKEIKNKLEK